MENKNKLGILVGLLSLSRLRGRNINGPFLANNNEDFINDLKGFGKYLDKNMLEFIYCYLFINLHELNKSTLYIEPNNLFTVETVTRDSIEANYKRDVFSLTRDRALPIKRKRETIRVLELNDREFDSKLTNDVTYFNSKAVEMIKLLSREESTSIYGVPINELFERAKTIPRDKVLFRTEENINVIEEIIKNKDNNKYEVNKYYVDPKEICKLDSKVNIFSGKLLDSEKDLLKYPSSTREYFKAIYEKMEEKKEEHNLENIDYRTVDEDIIKMITKIEKGGEDLDYIEEKSNTRSR